MIDEKKLIEDIEKEIEFAMKCNMPAMVAGMRQIASVIEEQPKIGEWIPCSERFPEENGTYIVNAIENHIVHVTFAKWMPHRMREALTAVQNVASLMGFELVEVRDKRTGRLYKCDRE